MNARILSTALFLLVSAWSATSHAARVSVLVTEYGIAVPNAEVEVTTPYNEELHLLTDDWGYVTLPGEQPGHGTYVARASFLHGERSAVRSFHIADIPAFIYQIDFIPSVPSGEQWNTFLAQLEVYCDAVVDGLVDALLEDVPGELAVPDDDLDDERWMMEFPV